MRDSTGWVAVGFRRVGIDWAEGDRWVDARVLHGLEIGYAGALLELDPYLKRDKRNIPDVVPSVLEYWTRDGHTYGLPNAHAHNLTFNTTN